MPTLRGNIPLGDNQANIEYWKKIGKNILKYMRGDLPGTSTAALKEWASVPGKIQRGEERPSKYLGTAGLSWASGALTGGILGGGSGVANEIKGFTPEVTRALRKAMQREFKSRGSKESAAGYLGADPMSKTIQDTLRGVFWHGRQTYPEPRVEGGILKEATFESVRRKKTKIGEPTGISLTSDPGVADRFGDYQGFSRVTPRFGGPPEKNILRAWEEPTGQILKQEYDKAAAKLLSENKEHPVLRKAFSEDVSNKDKFIRALSRSGTLLEEFNTTMTKGLEERGYKGIIYNPNRYNEYELKLFNPANALRLDKRSMIDKGVDKLIGNMYKGVKKRNLQLEIGLEDRPAHLKDFYREQELPSQKAIEESGIYEALKKDLTYTERMRSTFKEPKIFDTQKTTGAITVYKDLFQSAKDLGVSGKFQSNILGNVSKAIEKHDALYKEFLDKKISGGKYEDEVNNLVLDIATNWKPKKNK